MHSTERKQLASTKGEQIARYPSASKKYVEGAHLISTLDRSGASATIVTTRRDRSGRSSGPRFASGSKKKVHDARKSRLGRKNFATGMTTFQPPQGTQPFVPSASRGLKKFVRHNRQVEVSTYCCSVTTKSSNSEFTRPCASASHAF